MSPGCGCLQPTESGGCNRAAPAGSSQPYAVALSVVLFSLGGRGSLEISQFLSMPSKRGGPVYQPLLSSFHCRLDPHWPLWEALWYDTQLPSWWGSPLAWEPPGDRGAAGRSQVLPGPGPGGRMPSSPTSRHHLFFPWRGRPQTYLLSSFPAPLQSGGSSFLTKLLWELMS